MYPIKAILIGSNQSVLPLVKRELVNCSVRLEGEFFSVEHATDALRRSSDEKRILILILDYNLRQGNGLHCLKELRTRDPVVPIIAISGVATAEVAADLVQGGADDYINKRELTSRGLARSMRDALKRADAWRE